MSRDERLQNRIAVSLAKQRRLKEELRRLGFIMSGSISRRRIACGNRTCACRKDPAARHGPYIYWTTKKRGKTVARLIKNEEAELCREWIENRKRLEKVVGQWIRLSERTFGTALRLRVRSARKYKKEARR